MPISAHEVPPLGILMLATAFPRLKGDVGCAQTFAFPVRYAVPSDATVEAVVHRQDDALLAQFVAAGHALVAQGCCAITSTCGFLARWQPQLAQALPVPVATSALQMTHAAQRLLPPHGRAGIVTYSAAALDADTLAGAGVPPETPIEGLAPDSYFARSIRFGAATLDRARMAADVVLAARRLVAAHPLVGAIVLECANMPPYADDVADATGMPVFDAAQLANALHANAVSGNFRSPLS